MSDAGKLVEEGRRARREGRLEEALSFYERAAAAYRTGPDPLRLAHTVRHLGDIHRQAGRPEIAEPLHREALAIYRDHPGAPPLDLANAIRPLAILEERAGRTDEARRLWTEARDLYEACGVSEGAAESSRRLAALAGTPGAPVAGMSPSLAGVSRLNGRRPGETIGTVSNGMFGRDGRRGGRGGRAALLLLTISALLFVGIQSRLAQRLPTRSPEELLTSFSDPVKFPPPEEKSLEDACAILSAVECIVPAPPARPLAEVRTAPSDAGEPHASTTLLRAPPRSL